MFEHPLGMPPKDARPHQIIGCGEEFAGVATVAVDYSLNFPVNHGEHNWLNVIHLPVTAQDLRSGSLPFRLHRLAGMHIYCWVCERDLDEHVLDGPCLGDPQGRPIPTRAEFRGWSDEQRSAWYDAWTSRS